MTSTSPRPEIAAEIPSRPADPPADWLTFHLTHADSAFAFDPNGAFFWAGRYHLHYLYVREDGIAYAHVSSSDLVHWRWHPTVLHPTATGHQPISGGGFVTKEGRPAIIYHGQERTNDEETGLNQVVVALDNDLDSWTAPVPVRTNVRSEEDRATMSAWDPDGWLEGDTYYAISGGLPGKIATLHRSTDLEAWDHVGPLLSHDLPDAAEDGDLSCPNLFPLGNEHMLLCISHNLGCRYYLGEWKDEVFTPRMHARMNWHRLDCFAPESVLTPDGRRVMWAWCNIPELQTGVQSLPRQLSLPDDGILRIAPARELEILRRDERRLPGIVVTPDVPRPLGGVAGDALELAITIRRGNAARFGVRVHVDPLGADGLPIAVDAEAQTVAIGGVEAPFACQGDEVVLRVFVDKRLVEVFADDRQAILASHEYAPGNVHVSLFADAEITADVVAWRMSSIYDDGAA